jgi:putative toxin-antitoxin system antitoxin component (TIGR02293 family)
METHPSDRFDRILSKAISVFGDETTARRWMVQPLARFRNKTAMEMLSTEEGAQLTEQALVQIEEGMFT